MTSSLETKNAQTPRPLETVVDHSLNYYDVTNPLVCETIRMYPSLRFLLGRIASTSNGQDTRPDGVARPVYFLEEGSGMFGLTHPEDAMRWRGIFNHIIGSARHVYYTAERLRHLTDAQIKQFEEFGFSGFSFQVIDPIKLRDFQFVSHAGRRQADERIWHWLRDKKAHPTGDSGKNTYTLLQTRGAPKQYLEWMRVEQHAHLLRRSKDNRYFPVGSDNVLTFGDWTFDQRPMSITERFGWLRLRKRQPEWKMDILDACGNRFEQVLGIIVDPHFFEHMVEAGPYDWETQIRQAYCSPSGLSMKDVFPGYLTQYPHINPAIL